jgi:hypothetical protein
MEYPADCLINSSPSRIATRGAHTFRIFSSMMAGSIARMESQAKDRLRSNPRIYMPVELASTLLATALTATRATQTASTPKPILVELFTAAERPISTKAAARITRATRKRHGDLQTTFSAEELMNSSPVPAIAVGRAWCRQSARNCDEGPASGPPGDAQRTSCVTATPGYSEARDGPDGIFRIRPPRFPPSPLSCPLLSSYTVRGTLHRPAAYPSHSRDQTTSRGCESCDRSSVALTPPVSGPRGALCPSPGLATPSATPFAGGVNGALVGSEPAHSPARWPRWESVGRHCDRKIVRVTASLPRLSWAAVPSRLLHAVGTRNRSIQIRSEEPGDGNGRKNEQD